jgi:hypothetical protein
VSGFVTVIVLMQNRKGQMLEVVAIDWLLSKPPAHFVRGRKALLVALP